MRRQALYRIEWDEASDTKRPPPTITVHSYGPWLGDETWGQLLYEGPLGRTTVTVEYKEPI